MRARGHCGRARHNTPWGWVIGHAHAHATTACATTAAATIATTTTTTATTAAAQAHAHKLFFGVASQRFVAADRAPSMLCVARLARSARIRGLIAKGVLAISTDASTQW